MFRQLRHKGFFLIPILFVLTCFTSFAQERVPRLDLTPLFARGHTKDLHDDSEFALRRISTSSIDTLWHSSYASEDFDVLSILDNLMALKLRKGLHRLPDFVRAVSYHISIQLEQGRPDKSKIAYYADMIDKMLTIDPESFEAYTLKAQVTLKRSYLYFIPALYFYTKGLILSSFSLDSRGIYIASFLYTFHYAILLSAFIFFIILLIKYFGVFKHEMAEQISIKPNNKLFLLILLMFSALWFFAGIIPTIVLFSAVLFVYYNNYEKLILIICLLSMLFSIISFNIFNRYVSIAESPVTQALILSYSQEYDAFSVDVLEKYTVENPDDIAAAFVLANYYSRANQVFEALTLYKSISERKDFPELNINIGNIYYILNDFTQAQQYYERAAECPENKAIAYFNLAQLSLERRLFTQEAHRYFELVKNNDPSLFMLYQDLSHKNLNTLTALGLPRELLSSHISKITSFESKSGPLYLLGMKVDNLPYIGILGIVFIILLNLFRIRMNISYKCSKCGKSYCSFCSTRYFSDNICSSCHQVFIIKKGIHPKVRVEKIIDIDNYKKVQLFISKLLTIFTLGGGFVLYNKPFKAFLYIFFYVVFISVILRITPIFKGWHLPFVEDFNFARYITYLIVGGLILNNFKSMTRLSQKYHTEK